MFRLNSNEYDLTESSRSNGRKDKNISNYYNNSLSGDYENSIKYKSNKLRRKSKSLTEKLFNIDSDGELNNNSSSIVLLNKSTLTNSTSNTIDSSSYFDTTSQEHNFESQSHVDTISTSESDRFNTKPKVFKEEDIIIENGHIKSGTLDKIIDYLIEIEENEYKKSAIFCILLCARIFEPPHKMFKNIFNKVLYEYSSYGIYKKEKLDHSLKKLINILSDWAQLFPYDFRNQKMMKIYRVLTNKCLNMNINLKDDIIGITSNLLINIRNLELYESYLNKIHYEASLKLQKSVIETNILFVAQDARTLAKQLTHIELDRLKHISAEEFIQYCNLFDSSQNYKNYCLDGTNSLDNSNSNKITNKNTSNIEAYIQWFNRLSNLVSTEIVKHLKRDTRVKIINFFIDVAQECFNNGNFNSLMAIIASLNMTCVSRLKKTWIKIDRQKLDILQKHLEFNNNYSSYRQLLQTAKAQLKQNSPNIVIPFFALIMKDLTSLNDGIPNKFDNGHINFEKFWKIAKYTSELLNLKNFNCQYPERNKIINYLLTTPLLTEDGCVLASYECEPPDNENEKKHRDKLRLKVQESSYFYQSFD